MSVHRMPNGVALTLEQIRQDHGDPRFVVHHEDACSTAHRLPRLVSERGWTIIISVCRLSGWVVTNAISLPVVLIGTEDGGLTPEELAVLAAARMRLREVPIIVLTGDSTSKNMPVSC